jgi:hypothetical protein
MLNSSQEGENREFNKEFYSELEPCIDDLALRRQFSSACAGRRQPDGRISGQCGGRTRSKLCGIGGAQDGALVRVQDGALVCAKCGGSTGLQSRINLFEEGVVGHRERRRGG